MYVHSGNGDEFVFLCYSLQFPQEKLIWAPFGTPFSKLGVLYLCIQENDNLHYFAKVRLSSAFFALFYSLNVRSHNYECPQL